MAPHCGDVAARYFSDSAAHGFQIMIDAEGDDCDVTGEGIIVGIMVTVQCTDFHTSIYSQSLSLSSLIP